MHFIYLFVYLFIYLFIYLLIYLFIYYLFIFNLSTMVFLYSVIYFILHNHTILVSVFTEMKTFKHYARDHTTSIFLILQMCTKQEGGSRGVHSTLWTLF